MATRNESTGLSVETVSQARGKDEITRGKVGEVRQQFQVHEDTALAYKIQSEEIENHVSRNREQRKSVRDNIKTAKETYLEEVKIAGVLPENSVAEIEQKQWLAEELHRRVEEQEIVVKANTDKQQREDEEIALRVQREEEKNLRYLEHKRHQKLTKAEEEHRRLRKIMQELETANLSNDTQPSDRQDDESSEIITLADGTEIDAKHNEVQTEEQKIKHMQKRDEELAKILQEQEDLQIEKQKNIHEDLRKAIELQDREIAKHLQRQEKAKAEKRREKIRRGQSLPERDELLSSNRRHLPTYHEAIGVDDVETNTPYDEDNSEIRSKYEDNSERRSKYEDSSERRSKYEDSSVTELQEDRRKHRSKSEDDDIIWSQRDNSGIGGLVDESGAHYDNVAETLDPTFQRPHQHDFNDKGHEPGNKSAQMVPPLKRKSSKDKRRDKDCKQQ